MNKKRTLYYLGLSFIVLGMHFTLLNFGVLKGLLKTAYIVDGAIAVIIFLSVLIIWNRNPEKFNFTQRFILLTTFQFLSFLSLIAALKFSDVLDLQFWGMSVATIFLLILIIQSVLLLLSIRGNSAQKTEKESD